MKIRILFVFVILLTFTGLLFNQEKEIKEDVTVTNIEIPVRVFLKGELVDNLKKNDFTLFINGKKRDVAAFTVTRKRLEEQEIELVDQKAECPPRYFIMALNITNFSPEIKKGVDYVLNNILKKKDALLVFINNTTKVYLELKDISSIREELFKYIEGESIKAHTRMLLYFKEIERASNFAKFKMMMKRGGTRISGEKEIYYINDFLKNYLNIWKEYKQRYLTPDVNTYYNLSKYLQNIKIEKWVISFFQVEMFPEIAISGEIARIIRAKVYDWQVSDDVEEVTFSRIISRQLSEVQKAMNVSEGFPTEQVTKIFTKVGATFHSVFIPSIIPTFSRDMTYKQISSDLENNLRSLTKKTGGELVASSDLAKAMDKIVKKEDVFYVLTYAPDDNEKLEDVKIKVSNKKYDLAYDDNARLAFSKKESSPDRKVKIPDVVISDLKFKKKKLSFVMSGYVKKKKEGTGAINVRIRINDKSGKSLFDKNKTLKTTKDKANLSLNFPWLKPGKYEVLVDVKDLYTGKTGTDLIKIKIR
ncbi:MAG: hypothetical protein ABFR36_04080 [Acidobacteriota bacterium]